MAHVDKNNGKDECWISLLGVYQAGRILASTLRCAISVQRIGAMKCISARKNTNIYRGQLLLNSEGRLRMGVSSDDGFRLALISHV